MKNAIEIEVAPGELIEKLTILEIKRERIQDAENRANVEVEFATLRSVCEARVRSTTTLLALRAELREVNGRFWEIEDEIRDCEQRQDFVAAFIALARAVYRTNDRRAALEREINLLLRSRRIEEKPYRAY
jgi:hypothetical protein